MNNFEFIFKLRDINILDLNFINLYDTLKYFTTFCDYIYIYVRLILEYIQMLLNDPNLPNSSSVCQHINNNLLSFYSDYIFQKREYCKDFLNFILF